MSHTDRLNPAQREAVLCTEGPLLVLAGAGAGKTRVIAHRILEIVQRGTEPEHVLAITFTNKAAGEMRERVVGLLREQGALPPDATSHSRHAQKSMPGFFGRAGEPFVSTFHSLGLLVLKENYKELGYKRTPAIYDRTDSMREIKAAMKQLGIEDMEPRTVLGVISKTKGQGIALEEFIEKGENFRDRAVASVWNLYDQALRKDAAVDFDDLLLRSMRFLEINAEARVRYQARWTHIHIDEYQDTNRVQAQMAHLLVGPARNICAVGDIDQTIYGWRGAEIANIIQFERTYPGAKVVLLEENYRSTQKILDAANTVIAKNPNRPEKNLFTKNSEGEQIGIYQAFDETDEAGFIARKIGELLRDGRGADGKKLQPRDFAVLYRANFQSRAIEEQLLAAGVPYQVLGTRFFERKEVKDTLSFIRAALLDTPADIHRVTQVLPGIGKVTALKILAGQEDTLRGAIAQKVQAMRTLLARIREKTSMLPPSQLIQFIATESGMEKLFKEDKLEGAERLENLRELGALAARYDALPTYIADDETRPALDAFMESAALASDQDELKDEANAVRLMTIHASKGLEFPIVFITGFEEGLFPYERDYTSSDSSGSGQRSGKDDQEEERRLCYVAITRAREKVFLTFASYRTIFGSKNATIRSQFIGDIPEHLLEWESPERLGKTIYL